MYMQLVPFNTLRTGCFDGEHKTVGGKCFSWWQLHSMCNLHGKIGVASELLSFDHPQLSVLSHITKLTINVYLLIHKL